MPALIKKQVFALSSSLLLSVLLFGQTKLQPRLVFNQGRIIQIAFPLSSIGSFELAQLALFTGNEVSTKTQKPSILGRFEVRQSELVFLPHFSLESNRWYTLQTLTKLHYPFKAASVENTPPKLLQIYPTTDQLPSNLLKFYLHFSEPMQAGNSYAQIALINQKGDTLEAPFVVLSPELWNDDFTRLTLWLDPGRIKRDLGPNQSLGPVLQLNQSYELMIKGSWKNQKGMPLQKKYKKSFRAIAPDREKVNWKQWSLSLPSAASSAPLSLQFPKSLDAALLQRMIQVFDAEQQKIECTFKLGPNEKSLEVIPTKNWQLGAYHLRIDTYLEDICGNNLLRPFDRDLKADWISEKEEDFVFLSFEIKN